MNQPTTEPRDERCSCHTYRMACVVHGQRSEDKQRELKPCPFCGSKADFSWSRDGEVVNVRCERWGKDCMGAGANVANEEQAAWLWNRRAPQSSCTATFPTGWELVPEKLTEGMARALEMSSGGKASEGLVGYWQVCWDDALKAAPVPESGESVLEQAARRYVAVKREGGMGASATEAQMDAWHALQLAVDSPDIKASRSASAEPKPGHPRLMDAEEIEWFRNEMIVGSKWRNRICDTALAAMSSTAATDQEWVEWLQGELAEVMRLVNKGLFGDKQEDELTDAMRLHGIRLLLAADTEKYERLLSAVSTTEAGAR